MSQRQRSRFWRFWRTLWPRACTQRAGSRRHSTRTETKIHGDVTGEVFSGEFHSPVVKGDVTIGHLTISVILKRLLWLLPFLLILVIASLITAGANARGLRQTLLHYDIISDFDSEQSGETLIVVVPFFHSNSDFDTDEAGLIKEAIEQEMQVRNILSTRIEVAEGKQIRGEDRAAAQALGERYRASMIGLYRPTFETSIADIETHCQRHGIAYQHLPCFFGTNHSKIQAALTDNDRIALRAILTSFLEAHP